MIDWEPQIIEARQIGNYQWSKAWDLANKVHEGQTDLLGEAYVQGHIFGVVKNVKEHIKLHGCPMHIRAHHLRTLFEITAILHDVCEDGGFPPDNLREYGFHKLIIDAVDSVTRRENEKYQNFIKRAKQNFVGRIVKMADLQNNLDVRRIKFSLETRDKDLYRIEKYIKSYLYLENKMPEEDYMRK